MGTTSRGYPYPEGTDLVVDGDDAIKALAEAINTKVPFATASGSSNVTNVASQDTKASTVTLPPGLFSSAPKVVAMATTTSPSTRSVSLLSGGSTSSFTLYAWNGTASTRDISANWIAVQDDGTALLAALGARVLAAADDPFLVGPVPADVYVACPNEACPYYGVTIPVSSAWIDEDGVRHDVDTITCGTCETDLTSTMTPIE